MQAHDAVELADWVRLVRKANRGGWVPAELRAALDELGFEWDVPLLDAQWHSCFHAARASKVARDTQCSRPQQRGSTIGKCLIWNSLPFHNSCRWHRKLQKVGRHQEGTRGCSGRVPPHGLHASKPCIVNRN